MPQLILTATKDCYVSEMAQSTNYNTNPLRLICGPSGRTWVLLGFDMSSLPSDAIISNAQLELNFLAHNSGTGFGGGTIAKHLYEDWPEHLVSWGNKPSSIDTISAAYSTLGVIRYTVTSLVSKNIKGLHFYGSYPYGSESAVGDMSIADRTTATPPKLIIDYALPPTPSGVVHTCTANAMLNTGSPSSPNTTTMYLGTATSVLLKFAPISIPDGKRIKSIKFRYKANAGTALSIPLSYVDGAWTEGVVTQNLKPATTLVKNIALNATNLYNEVDITEMDVNRINNFGIHLGAAGATRLLENRSSAYPPYLDVVFEDKPPSTPTIIKPIGGMLLEQTAITRVEWDSIDTQHSYEVEHSQDGVTWVTTSGTSAEKKCDIPANILPLGYLKLRVRYRTASGGTLSAYSPIVDVKVTSKPPTPTITTASSLTVATPTIAWTSQNQASFELTVGDKVYSVGSSAQSFTIPDPLTDNSNYIIKLRVANTDGVWSDYASKAFTTNFPKPAKPSLTAVVNDKFIRVTAANSDSAKNDIYKVVDGVPRRIAKGLSSGVAFDDYRVAHGKAYTYFARAINTQYGAIDSDSLARTLTLDYGDLMAVDNSFAAQFKFNIKRTISNRIEATDHRLAGRKMPIREFSENESRSVAITFEVMTIDEANAVEAMAMLKKVVAYRDLKGRLIYVSFTGISVDDQTASHLVTLNDCIEVDYSEVV